MRSGSSTTAVARSSGKTLSWSIYAKKTSVLSTALSSGTWTDVTGRVDYDQLSDVTQSIELGTGQYTIDSYNFTAVGIVWWKANLLNVASNEFVEVKVLSTVAGVPYNMFCGFVDVNRDGYKPQELTDSIALVIRTAEDIGSRMPGENITVQYVHTNGLVLLNIPNLYVTNANVASYVLRVGTHTVTYDYNAGTRRAKLDGGTYVTLSAGSNTLGNVDNTTNDTQRIVINTPTLANLPSTGVLTDEVVVVTAGTTYPSVWYRNTTVKALLKLAYTQIGITCPTFDTMEFASYDGGLRYLELDTPPIDGTVHDDIYASCVVGSSIYMGIGNKLYKRDMTTDTYTLVRTLTAGRIIVRMFYNSRNDHIWMVLGTTFVGNNTAAQYIQRYTVAADKLSAELSLIAAPAKGAKVFATALYDFNYTGASYKYSLVYCAATTNEVREVLGSAPDIEGQALTDSLIFSGATLSATIASDFLHLYTSGTVRVLINDSASPFAKMYSEVGVNSGGTWVNNGHKLTGGLSSGSIDGAVYNSSEDKIYYVFPFSSFASHPSTSTTYTTVFTSGLTMLSPFVGGDNKTYISQGSFVSQGTTRQMYSVVSNVATLVTGGTTVNGLSYSWYNGRLYGVSVSPSYIPSNSLGGNLFHVSSILPFQVSYASFKDISIKDVIYKLCRSFNLLPIISSDKGARVYRRGDSTGTPQTSGNSIALSMSDISDIEENTNAFPPFDLVRIVGQTLTTTYDGTTFDSAVLSTKDALEINSPYIPDAIIKDIAYYVYQFFKTKRTLYKLKLASTPLFQYEPFDGSSITLTGKIVKTGSGVIYSASYSPKGDMAMEVLI